MSSSIPYDPDEFDNNPFAEPATNDTPTEPPAVPVNSEPPAVLPKDTDPKSKSGNSEATSQHLSQKQQPSPTSLIPERHDAKNYKLKVRVNGLERSGSLSNKKENPGIIFDLQTNLPIFRKKSYKGIKKSHQEFVNFFRFLNGANPESFIPSIPEPSTNYGIQNQEDYKKVISDFQLWFQRVTSNPILIRNEEFAYFVDSDFNTYSPINKSKLPATGIKRKTLKQLQPPYDEALELAEFRPLIKSIYQDSKSIIEKLERLTKLRRTLAGYQNELGDSLSILNELEKSHPGMQLLWTKIGNTVTNLGDLESVIGVLDLATLGDGLQSVVNDGYVIKEALTNRHLLMRELITAQSHTKVKHENARKLRNKRDINPIKVDEAIQSLQEAITTEEKLTKKINRITEEMLIEKKEYLDFLDSQVKQILKEFVVTRIAQERKKLLVLEKVRLDVRQVDDNGGLSRLGRENYPKRDLTNITSQGPNGDSWSGDRKSSHFNSNILKLDEPFEAKSSGTSGKSDLKAGEEEEEEEEETIDAKNAASILGTSTF